MEKMQLFYQSLQATDRVEDQFLSMLVALLKAKVEQVKALTEGLGWEEW